MMLVAIATIGLVSCNQATTESTTNTDSTTAVSDSIAPIGDTNFIAE